MASVSQQPHFVLFPFMAQGHLLPMVDIGRLLAQRDVIVTIVTTPHNAARVQKSIARAIELGHPIRLVQLRFPGNEVGFPDGVENVDIVHSSEDFRKFFIASNKMEESVEKLFERLTPRPNCIISDVCLYYTHKIATRFKEYMKVTKAWCVGPVSLSHTDESDKAERGNKASIDEQQCLKWLDSQETNSVIYACLGSISTVKCPELIELGLGIEASNKPFIWVLRGNNATSNEVEKWMAKDGFEERTKGRGLVVKGWAPQVLILSHRAVGGLLTHCGWNSTIEGISAGIPLLTFPLFGDQFINEKLAVQILKIGVSLGINKPTNIGDGKSGFLLKKEHVKNAIEKLMDEGDEGMERRKRARVFGEKAKKAVDVGGSSYLSITSLIKDIMQQSYDLR
ncbi:UDP-glycosyltransferase 73C4 [Hibiscus syriacus]|uniref:UDP-glycosyltransferase 73C4 n=1 Tax=Hibiscus syriacus TaxID=106335 RepID=A0A6A2YBH6_HIBSY|nr:UDP-glycosyltransferase 73C4 [Hibiscus syriacus]